MHPIDWVILAFYFVLLIGIGVWTYRRVHSSDDFFTAGGKLPWWLSGVSHHVSGYSGALFVAYAGVAYTSGFCLYIWWACGVALSVLVAAFFIAPRWSRLKSNLHIQSPTEYLSVRYNLPAQQIMAWSGMIIKFFDVGAKWAAIAVLMNVIAGTSLITGIVIAGSVSLIYSVLGGLWADVINDFAQFLIQVVAGFTMFFLVLKKLGNGIDGIFTMWKQLPPSHSHLINPPYTGGFLAAVVIIYFFSYGGGTWHLAARFISSSSDKEAKKAALLSSFLYLVWPLIILFPMFAAPIFLPHLADPTKSYALLVEKFLPAGLTGLVLASLFTNTLSMTSSDANTISAVFNRDILPHIFPEINKSSKRKLLAIGRISTFMFILITVIIAIYAKDFGGVFGLIVSWFIALIGPISIPMILGLLPIFKQSDSTAAIISIFGGVAAFIITKSYDMSLGISVGLPMVSSLIIFVGMGLIWGKKDTERAKEFFNRLDFNIKE